MAGLGTLVEARFGPLDRVDDIEPGWLALGAYEGPPCVLAITQGEDLRSICVRGAPEGCLRVAWGTLDSIDDIGAYRRLADGVRTMEDSDIGLTVRLVGTSVRTSGRWLAIDVDDGPRYEVRRSVFRGTRLQRDGVVVAKGFGGKVIDVSDAATGLDATLVAAVKSTLWSMLSLPKLPEIVIPGD